jgi:hypothetical protein
MVELSTILGIEDLFDLLEIVAVDAYNKVTAQKFYDADRY